MEVRFPRDMVEYLDFHNHKPGMICEMCGNNVPSTRAFMVEGTMLNLCPNCSRFGDSYRSSNRIDDGSSHAGSGNNTVIKERLEKRERRMQTRDIYSANGGVELITDYGTVVRKAREKKGLTAEDFAKSINEKKGTIVKIESQTLVPDDKLIAKLEKALSIKLKEAMTDGGTVGGGQKSQGMTLGNFIKVEKK